MYRSGNTDAKPDEFTINTLLKAWSSIRKNESVEEYIDMIFDVLRQIEKFYVSGDAELKKPLKILYQIGINTLEEDSNEQVRLKELRSKMKHL